MHSLKSPIMYRSVAILRGAEGGVRQTVRGRRGAGAMLCLCDLHGHMCQSATCSYVGTDLPFQSNDQQPIQSLRQADVQVLL